MDLAQLCWLSTAAYAIHVIEELMFDWKGWARAVLHLPVEWNIFYVTNAAVMIMGIVAAEIAPRLPLLALSFPALMLINATFFHVAPFVTKRGRFSPGLLSAILLFYPLGTECFRVARSNGAVTLQEVLEAFLIGALLMATPIVFLKVKNKPYFRQDHES